ncbi:nickel/cobalt homeostasis protein RcnB [Erwinia sp. CPCC 100877]|nr:nickel/cobalt homeostasis protein RcnB [Erwinia sp. CPCC 100877]
MAKSRIIMLSMLLSLGSALSATTLYAQQPADAAKPGEEKPESHEISQLTADFQRFEIGDRVPEIYRSKSYEIAQWKQRNLPAPQPDSHWTYMGGNYVLISNARGKILKAESGDIFYSR